MTCSSSGGLSYAKYENIKSKLKVKMKLDTHGDFRNRGGSVKVVIDAALESSVEAFGVGVESPLYHLWADTTIYDESRDENERESKDSEIESIQFSITWR